MKKAPVRMWETKEKSAPEGAERRIVAILVYQEAALLFLAQLRKECA